MERGEGSTIKQKLARVALPVGGAIAAGVLALHGATESAQAGGPCSDYIDTDKPEYCLRGSPQENQFEDSNSNDFYYGIGVGLLLGVGTMTLGELGYTANKKEEELKSLSKNGMQH